MDSLRKIAELVKDPTVTVDLTGFLFALSISLVSAYMLSILYRIFYENRATGSQVHRCFIILGPSITAIFIAIQHSLPLSLGLLGALSIIRFRTPIKEPEEIGFIMLLCACSVVIATFQIMLLVGLLSVVLIGLSIRTWLMPSLAFSKRTDGILVISACSEAANLMQTIRNALEQVLKGAKLESISEVEGVMNLQYSFCDLSESNLLTLRERLGAISEIRSLNVYFNQTNSLV